MTTACFSTGHQDVQTAQHDLHQHGVGDKSVLSLNRGCVATTGKKKIGWHGGSRARLAVLTRALLPRLLQRRLRVMVGSKDIVWCGRLTRSDRSHLPQSKEPPHAMVKSMIVEPASVPTPTLTCNEELCHRNATGESILWLGIDNCVTSSCS